MPGNFPKIRDIMISAKIYKNSQPIPSIYEITERILYTEFLMNKNESGNDIICNRCMVTWENYYEYLFKHIEEIFPRWILENNPHNLV